jgi:hypothetical protein
MKHQHRQCDLQITNAGSILRSLFFAAAIFALASLFSLSTLSVEAQSGRRAPRSTATPAPTPEPTPAEKKPAEKDKTALKLIVGIDSHEAFGYIPQYFYDTVLQTCAERLDLARSVNVETQRDMNRSDAAKRAKAENAVVFLRLRLDNMGNNNSSPDLSQVYIEYVVFAATTAKVIASGNTYQGSGNRGVLGVPSTSRSTAAVELRLKQAARDAAERILDALHIAVRPAGPFQ